MTTMRAVLVKGGKGGIEDLHIGEAPKPSPSADEVLVEIKAFGLNRMDISQREGKYPVPAGASSILGVEFSGTISAIGSGVNKWKVGDEVFGLAPGGAYAEYITVRQTHIIPKHPYLSWVDAAAIPENWLTAFQAIVMIGQIKEGDDVLVHAGASGVGICAIQLARFHGANNVIATTSTQEKIDWLLKLRMGPTHAINYKTQDFAEEVKKITNGKGVDIIEDFVGRSHWHKNIDALAMDGRMTMQGLMSGAEVEKVNLGPILYKRLHIEGSTLRSRSVEYQTDLIARFRDDLCGQISAPSGKGKLNVLIHKVYPWSRIQEAHREMEEDKNSGKIIVEVEKQ